MAGSIFRIVVRFKEGVKDALGEGIKSSVMDDLGIGVSVKTADAYEIEGISDPDISKVAQLLADAVVQDFSVNQAAETCKDKWAVEIGFLPGVTDNAAETARQSIKEITGKDVSVKASKLYFIEGATKKEIENICSQLLFNKLIQFCRILQKTVNE